MKWLKEHYCELAGLYCLLFIYALETSLCLLGETPRGSYSFAALYSFLWVATYALIRAPRR